VTPKKSDMTHGTRRHDDVTPSSSSFLFVYPSSVMFEIFFSAVGCCAAACCALFHPFELSKQ
jgi:hypothetical protein